MANDAQGTTNLVLDETSALKEKIEYTPWGEVKGYDNFGNSAEVARFYFTGKKLDEESGLIFFGARYYNPKLGRFITPDTIIQDPSNMQTWNRYTYCNNNPVSLVDRSGHSWASFLSGIASNGAGMYAGAFVVGVLTGGAGFSLMAVIAGGATAGAVSGGINAVLSGGGIKGILTGMAMGAAAGAVGGAVLGSLGNYAARAGFGTAFAVGLGGVGFLAQGSMTGDWGGAGWGDFKN